jgi:hypothetical protein
VKKNILCRNQKSDPALPPRSYKPARILEFLWIPPRRDGIWNFSTRIRAKLCPMVAPTELETQNSKLETIEMELGIWNFFGTWNLELGTWNFANCHRQPFQPLRDPKPPGQSFATPSNPSKMPAVKPSQTMSTGGVYADATRPVRQSLGDGGNSKLETIALPTRNNPIACC